MAGPRGVRAVEVDGLKEVRRAVRQMDGAASDLKAVNLAAAEPVRETALTLVPVRSGALRGTIRSAGQAAAAVVRAGKGSAVPYAGVIHFGWPGHSIAPQPFLYDAIDRRRSDVIAIYERRIAELADKFEKA